jgi:biopolymer transport protein ExbB
MKRLLSLLLLCLVLLPAVSHAWWNKDWSARRKITLDTSATGAATQGGVSNAPVLIRLSTGNFPFTEAHPDGHDLRFIAGDDKTPLEFHIESWDATNELALVWVRVNKLDANTATGEIWVYYGNEQAPPASNPKSTWDAVTTLALHFSETGGAFSDASQYNHAVANTGGQVGASGLIGGSVVFDGSGKLSIAASPVLRVTANGFAASAWIKPTDATHAGVIVATGDGTTGAQLLYDNGRVYAKVAGTETPKVDVPPGAWHHVAVSVGEATTLYVDGKAVGNAAAKSGDFGGAVEIGAGFRGEIDEVEMANAGRTSDWFALAVGSQGEQARLVTVAAESEDGDGEGASYVGILLSAVTLDGWVVIAILMVMMVVSFGVMIGKGVFLARMAKANAQFQKRFAELPSDDVLAMAGSADGGVSGAKHSSLLRLYGTAATEVGKRIAKQPTLNSQAVDAIRASLDANLVRENSKLNSQMVLLTIAISGGPFLGLLGTVVGVMITFAAIAAAGDVNVNSIAPGIAAALVATVAGLGVAIPALFGYNWLAAQIKNISADMAAFTDELIGRIAERYCA